MRLTLPTAPIVLVALLALGPRVDAQLAPALGYVYPPGAAAGSTIDVRLGGYDLTPDAEYLVVDDRARLKITGTLGGFIVPGPPYWFGRKGRSSAFKLPREISATITLPDDLPRGPVHWRVASANGASGTAVLFVGDGPEQLESRYRDEPQQLDSLPVTVNGRLEKIAEVDRYRFTAAHDGPVAIDLYARRLGSDFHGVLQVRDQRGRLLTDVADTEGADCRTSVVVVKGRQYEVRVFDLDFRGNRAFVYRLELAPGPRVLACLPSGGQPGTTATITFVGRGVAGGGTDLETTTREVTFPGNPDRGWFDYRLKTPHGTAPPVTLLVDDLVESVEPAGAARPLGIGSAVTGTLASSGERDIFTLVARKGETIRLEARSRLIGPSLDPVLRVLDADGKSLMANDDLPGTLDAGLDFQPPTDATYRVEVSAGSGGDGTPAAVYRLTAIRSAPGFRLTMPATLAAPVAGTGSLTITAVRSGGFAGEIAIKVDGLPAGASVPQDTRIPKGKPSVKIALGVADTSATSPAFLTVTGTAMIDDQPVTRTARANLGGNLSPRDPTAWSTDRLLLVRTLKPAVKLELVGSSRQRPVHRGTTYPAEFLIVRDKEFSGPIRLRMAAAQGRHRQGITAPIVVVPKGAKRVLFGCFMPEWLETNRTTRMVIHAVVEQKDPTGRVRHLVHPAKGRVTMILEGALIKLDHAAPELTVRAGSSFEVPLVVVRSAKLPEPATIALDVPEQLRGLVKARPVDIGKAQRKAVLKIVTSSDPKLLGDWNLRITVTALQDRRWPAVSETRVPVRFVPSE